ncbi:MAG: hypothetical protein WKG07_29440 [Hymenobacter sp.]
MAATWPVGGEGGWDYISVDHMRRARLRLARHPGGGALDLASGREVGYHPRRGGRARHLWRWRKGRGHVSCGKTNTVVEFDPQTLAVTATVPAGTKPDALLYDEFSKRVFVFNNGATTAAVLGAATGQPVGTAELGGAPEAGVSDGKGTVFANLEDKTKSWPSTLKR